MSAIEKCQRKGCVIVMTVAKPIVKSVLTNGQGPSKS